MRVTLSDVFRAEVAADDISAEGEREAGAFHPPLAEVEAADHAVILVGELAFVNDESGVGVSGFDVLKDFVEGFNDVAEAFADGDGGGEEGGGHGAGDGDAEFFVGLEFVEGVGFFGDDHGAVVVTHGATAGHEGVIFGDVGIGVEGDGGDFEFGLHGAFVEGLDVLEDVDEIVRAGVHGTGGEAVKHEGVVGVGGVAEVDGEFFGHEGVLVGTVGIQGFKGTGVQGYRGWGLRSRLRVICLKP